MGGSAKYRAAKKASEQTMQERRIVGRNQRNNAINSKTDVYKNSRRRMNQILARNYNDEGQLVTDVLTKDEKLNFVDAYNSAMKTEPQITAAAKSVADSLNMPLLGELKRRKSVKSATEKRNDRKLQNNPDPLNDMVRFTHQVGESNFGNDVNSAIGKYEKAGYKVGWVNNTWRDPSRAYKGVNVTFKTPNGGMFEVQFHTQKSHALKENQLHKLYEDQRKFPYKSAKWWDYENQMLDLSRQLPVPNGVSNIRIY